MNRWILIVVAVAGCKAGSKAQPANPDCDLIRKTPQAAVAELSKKYPNDAVKVAVTIENCIAPSGADECERVAAIAKAIPSMSGIHASSATDFAATCRLSPPELRKCFLPSYALAHDVECAKLRAKLAGAAELPMKPAGCDGGSIDVVLTDEGAWVVTGKDPASRCYGARKGKELDRAWLETELSQFKTKDCKPSVAVAAEKDIRYQEVIAAMDVAVKVGLLETSIASLDDLGVTFAAGEERKAPQHCPLTTIASKPLSAAGPGSGGDAAGRTAFNSGATGGSDAIRQAPVIIVTKNEISFAGKTVVSMKDAMAPGGVIRPLKDALPAPKSKDAPIILQADQDTSSGVIIRITDTVKAAGYQNVLFAVKNK